MGNSQPKEQQQKVVMGGSSSDDDQNFSDAPLYVLYGSPDDEDSRRAVELLERQKLHHCKIGTDLINAALAGVPSFLHRHPHVPQIFACPSAEMLQDEAGNAPGALGATAHGAVTSKMCRYIGGFSQLEKFTEDEKPEIIYKTFDLPASALKGPSQSSQ